MAKVLVVSLLASNVLWPQSPENMLPDNTREDRMEWWHDSHFGLFIHWGLYCMPAGEWKGEISRKNYAEWAMHNFQIPLVEYRELAKDFNPTRFNPDEWAKLAADAGMGYFVLTTKHHDGFAMFHSETTKYNVVDATPFRRDVFGELADAFRKQGLRVGAYYSHDIDWSYPQGTLSGSYNTWDFEVAPDDNAPFDRYMHEKSLPQVEELATKYGPVDVFWFDVPRTVDSARGKLFHDLVRKHQPQAIINGRIAVPQGVYADYLVPGDNGYYTSPQNFNWECCATMNESWGYTKHEKEAKNSDELIEVLLKTVSSGGNLLLNIGPKPDGTIPDEQVAILKDIAAWMKDNKEAIHGSGANPFSEFFDWGYCTVNGTDIYLHVTEWSDGKIITLPRLQNNISNILLLGEPGRKLNWKKTDGNYAITLSGDPVHSFASVIKVICEGSDLVIDEVQLVESAGEVMLDVKYAQSGGQRMSTLRHSIVDSQAVAYFAGGHASERLTWDFEVRQPGKFKVLAECLQPGPETIRPRTVFLKFGSSPELEKDLNGSFPEKGQIDLGTVELDQAGPFQLALRVVGGRDNVPLYLRSMRLIRID